MSAPTKQRTNAEVAETVRKPVTYDAGHLIGIIDSIRNLNADGFSVDEIRDHLGEFLGFVGITDRWFIQEVVDLL